MCAYIFYIHISIRYTVDMKYKYNIREGRGEKDRKGERDCEPGVILSSLHMTCNLIFLTFMGVN